LAAGQEADGRQGADLSVAGPAWPGSSIDKNVTITGQSTEKANQNASSPRLFYTLFTRKSEG